MPTTQQSEAIDLNAAVRRAGGRAFSSAGSGPRLGRVGLEPEFFPVIVDGDGAPAGRMRLEGDHGVIATIDELAAHDPRLCARRGPPMGTWGYDLCRGGRITFEPGAQIEHSTAVHASAADAVADVNRVLALLRKGFDAESTVLAAVGMDLWHDVEAVPQQLRAGRYMAMAAYYDQRGPWGRVMMRNTASLQVNLDLGPEGVWQERWQLANLLSPVLIATFASSPGEGAVCTRARAWQELDPTRTGFPRRLVEGPGSDPRADYADAVLSADVMMVQGAGGVFEPGRPGWTFADWIADGHPQHGWPTADDLDYHMTTLFFEVRPRGFLEIRSGEAMPDRWRPVPVVLVTALIYDDGARKAALDVLGGVRPELPDLWRQAAVAGVHDERLATLAEAVWSIALDGAQRLPVWLFGQDDLLLTRRFLDAYPFRGRMLADDLAELLADDPATALQLAVSGSKEQNRSVVPC